MVQKQAQR